MQAFKNIRIIVVSKLIQTGSKTARNIAGFFIYRLTIIHGSLTPRHQYNAGGKPRLGDLDNGKWAAAFLARMS